MTRARRGQDVLRRHRVALAVGAGIVVASLGTAVLVSGAASAPARHHLFLGRLHPLVVHLPIGFLFLCLALEVLARVRRFASVRHAIAAALVLSALSAIAAVAAGFLLASGNGAGGELFEWHRRLGLLVAVGTVAALTLNYAASVGRSRALQSAYVLVLLGTVGLVTAAGHLGGTLARGPDYLTEYMPAPMLWAVAAVSVGDTPDRPSFTYPDEANIYEHLVAPVLHKRCVTCHGPNQARGDLRLDSPEAIRDGGTSGPVLTPGRAAESRLIRRIWLPADHEDVMPPRGRQPLTVVEAELLRWWIDQGAPFDLTMASAPAPPAGVQAILEHLAGQPEERYAPVLRSDVTPADSAAVERVRALGVALRPVAQGSNFLQASCVTAPNTCGGEQLRALLPLAQQLAVLDVGGTRIVDADLETIRRFPHLVRLHLERTAVGDDGITHLSGLRHLEYLNLYGTDVTDAGLTALESITTLRSLYLWQTGVTPAGVERLARALPHVRIDLGMDPDSASADHAARGVDYPADGQGGRRSGP